LACAIGIIMKQKVHQMSNLLFNSLLVMLILAIVSIFFVFIATVNIENNIARYEHVETLPFEFNVADRQHYFYHQNKYLEASEYVKSFDSELLQYDEYDSCYVYKTIPLTYFFGLLSKKDFIDEFVYRQSEDLLLKHKSIDKVEINEK
jgi:hypothetical protein